MHTYIHTQMIHPHTPLKMVWVAMYINSIHISLFMYFCIDLLIVPTWAQTEITTGMAADPSHLGDAGGHGRQVLLTCVADGIKTSR